MGLLPPRDGEGGWGASGGLLFGAPRRLFRACLTVTGGLQRAGSGPLRRRVSLLSPQASYRVLDAWVQSPRSGTGGERRHDAGQPPCPFLFFTGLCFFFFFWLAGALDWTGLLAPACAMTQGQGEGERVRAGDGATTARRVSDASRT